MASKQAFSRSRAVMARYDVGPHMVKWWGKVKADNGQITRHLSPFEQQPVAPWLKTFPKKTMDRAPYYITYFGTTMALVYGTVVGADAIDEATDREHRF